MARKRASQPVIDFDEHDIDALLNAIAKKNINQELLTLAIKACQNEIRRLQFHPDDPTECRADEIIDALNDADYHDINTVILTIRLSIAKEDFELAVETIKYLHDFMGELPKDDQATLEKALRGPQGEIIYRHALDQGDHGCVLDMAKTLTLDVLEIDPTLYRPWILALLCSVHDVKSDRTRKSRIKKALELYEAYKKLADPGYDFRLDFAIFLEEAEAYEAAYNLYLDNLNVVPTEKLRMVAAMDLWSFYTRLFDLDNPPKKYSETLTPYKRLLWLDNQITHDGINPRRFYNETIKRFGDTLNVLESNVLNDVLNEENDFKTLKIAAEKHAQRFPFDPLQFHWKAQAADGLFEPEEALSHLEKGIHTCEHNKVPVDEAEILLEDAVSILTPLCTINESVQPYDDFINQIPENWRRASLYLGKIEALFQFTQPPFTEAKRKVFKETLAKIPEWERDYQFKLSEIQYLIAFGELKKAKSNIKALRKEFEQNPDIFDDTLDELKKLEAGIDFVGQLKSKKNASKNPLVVASKKEAGKGSAKSTDDNDDLDKVNMILNELVDKGATVLDAFNLGGYAAGVAFTTPQMPKGIAYISTINLVERYQAKVGVPNEQVKDLCEVAIAIPYHEAKKIRPTDWRIQLLIFTLECFFRSKVAPEIGFYSKSPDDTKLPFCDYTALMLLPTQKPIIDSSYGKEIGEIVPLFDEEMDYGDTHSFEDFRNKLESVVYFPPKRRRRNACEGEHWKPLIAPENLKTLYQSTTPDACQIDPRILFEGQDVKIFFHVEPDESDSPWSGWVFLSDTSTREKNGSCIIESLNTLLNYCPYVAEYLDAPFGSIFIRHQDGRIEPATDIQVEGLPK